MAVVEQTVIFRSYVATKIFLWRAASFTVFCVMYLLQNNWKYCICTLSFLKLPNQIQRVRTIPKKIIIQNKTLFEIVT